MKHYIIPSLTEEMLGIAAIHTGENNINYKNIGMSRSSHRRRSVRKGYCMELTYYVDH